MSLQVLHSVAALRRATDGVRARSQTVGLVPTMGALHEGHLKLIDTAREQTDAVVVTLFVNPTQFGPNEDFERYPRDLASDSDRCAARGARFLFAPPVEAMYPAGESTRVQVHGLIDHLCGPFRPGHFEGVATIVTKLFAATGECVAVFGRKDYQQLKVVEQLARDLLLPVRIVGHVTVREPDGLAMSSRNAYLSAKERARARAIPTALSRAWQLFTDGEREASALESIAKDALRAADLAIEHLTVADPDQLTPYSERARVGERALVATAVRLGNTRLIDNIVLGEDPPPVSPI